jgi:hypothetical protein
MELSPEERKEFWDPRINLEVVVGMHAHSSKLSGRIPV